MVKKKCPICGKPYYDYIKHIWTHKAKTIKWLAEKRKEAPKKSTSKKHGDNEDSSLIHGLKALLKRYA